MALKKLEFRTQIAASKERVWQVLWQDETYRQWTSVFHEGSHAVSDWKEGSRVLFLGPDGSGMYSRIEKMVPNEKMFFTHLGIVKEGKEQPETPDTKTWAGAQENYTLQEEAGITTLSVSIDITGDHVESFKEAFPKGFATVKQLAEKPERNGR